MIFASCWRLGAGLFTCRRPETLNDLIELLDVDELKRVTGQKRSLSHVVHNKIDEGHHSLSESGWL